MFLTPRCCRCAISRARRCAGSARICVRSGRCWRDRSSGQQVGTRARSAAICRVRVRRSFATATSRIAARELVVSDDHRAWRRRPHASGCILAPRLARGRIAADPASRCRSASGPAPKAKSTGSRHASCAWRTRARSVVGVRDAGHPRSVRTAVGRIGRALGGIVAERSPCNARSIAS